MTEAQQDQPRPALPEPGARQPRFSREQIAAVAIEIADAEGFDAVSMRKIARALGAGTMSLYRYVETKADLLALLDDAVLGEALLATDLPSDWRDALALVTRRTRAAYLRHPWSARLLLASAARADGPDGPNRQRHHEQLAAAVAQAPLDPATKPDLIAVVLDYLSGHLLRSAGGTDQGNGQFELGLQLIIDGALARSQA
jgi:AcrR family transcriptional regulator